MKLGRIPQTGPSVLSQTRPLLELLDSRSRAQERPVASSGLAADAVAVSVQAVAIFADHGDRTRVFRAIATPARAVVIGCARAQAGARVIRVAFARFFFSSRFQRFSFFGRRSFSGGHFGFFGVLLAYLCTVILACDHARVVVASDHPRVAPHRYGVVSNRLPLRSRMLGAGARAVAAAAANGKEDGGLDSA